MEKVMTDMRKVEYLFNAVELQQLKDNTSATEVIEALGYLSQWNFTFPRVAIHISSKHDELIARYFRDDNSLGYVIGGVWHDDHFGFHS